MVDDATLANFVRAGRLTPPVIGPGGEIPRKPIAKLADLLREIDRDRSDH